MIEYAGLESLPRETLIKLAKMYSRNWQSLDGLWFKNVEMECGLDTAVRIDLQNWEKQAVTEAKRIKEILGLNSGGLNEILTVLSFMSWQLTSPLFEIETNTEERVVMYYTRCAVQDGRTRQNKQVFPCKQMKQTLLTGLASVVEPRAKVTCLHCPPDARNPDYWCKWQLTLD